MGTTPDLETTVRVRFGRALALTLIIATALLVGSQNTSGRLFLTPPVAADAGAAGPAVQSRGTGVDFESAIGGRYGGFDVAVLNSRGLQTNSSGVPIIVTEIAVRNATDRELRLPESLFGLQSESGEHFPIQRFDHTEFSTRLVLAPGVIHTATAVVRLPPLARADLDLYRFRVAEPFRTPLLLPLVAESLSPADGVDSALNVGIALSESSDVSVLELTSTLNHRAYRAPVGQHLVTLTVDVASGPGTTLADISKSRWWSLIFDDQVISPSLVTIEAQTGTSGQVTTVFEVPLDVPQLSLVTGEADAAVHRADLTVTANTSGR